MTLSRSFRFTAPALVALLVAACGGESADSAGTSEAPGTAPAEMEAPAATSGLVNPNDASADALAALPGMDAATAEAMVAGRPFADMLAVDALLAGSMDEAAREELYRTLFIPLDLNEASEEEILLIPGVGSRMAHEFDEYRPYEAMERFRREIGKYVDEAEVARLEQYVVIR